MDRILNSTLLQWKKSSRRKPLILRGARQVGKSWLVEHILGPEFKQIHTIDFELRRDLHRLFEGNLDPLEILKILEFETGKIIPGETLLFFDEIQACPRAIMALRYFYEKLPALHVVAAGSLLEFVFSEISIPVGRVQYLFVNPMTFYEYLLAMGKDLMAAQVIAQGAAASEEMQLMILKELKNYFFVGGMPEAVNVYAQTNSMLDVFSVHAEILNSYRDDFSKYKPQVNAACIDEVFLNISRSVGEQLKYTQIGTGFSYKTNQRAFDVLTKARMIHKISSCDPSGIPLGATANERKFKGALLDIGLLQRMCQLPAAVEMKHSNLLSMFRGKLAEQFVAQELIAWHAKEIHYWSRDVKNSSAEIDYLTTINGSIYPIEVKSGPAGKLRSLHLMLKKYDNCPKGFVLYSGKEFELPEQKIHFLPLYATPRLGDKANLGL